MDLKFYNMIVAVKIERLCIAYAVLLVRNRCDTPPQVKYDHLMISKANRNAHGFGLKGISQNLKKYHGDFEWNCDAKNRMFIVTAMIGKYSI